MSTEPLNVLLAGGGTAGHIEPALAVGEALVQRHGAQLTALGTTKGLEQKLIPARGVDLRLITPVPIPRKKPLQLAAVPFKLARSISQVRAVMRETKTTVVFGTGGYVAAPAYLAAKTMGIRFFMLEPNAVAGMANKLGAKLGGVGFNAVAGSGMPGEIVGVPVRPGFSDDFAAKASRARQKYVLDADRPVLLVTGGSQGAQSINKAVWQAAADLIARGWQILHAYGAKNTPPEELKGVEHYHGVPYIDEMDLALAAASLTVGRSGAMTVAEVSAAGVPAIYVPLPHGNGEQAKNSRGVVEAGGAIQIPDAELTPTRLISAIEQLPDLEEMKRNLKTSGAGDVAEQLADRIAADVLGEQDKENN